MSNSKLIHSSSIPDGTPKILIVDDEPTNLRVLRHILNDDYRLFFAKNGVEALRLVESEKPNLILLDVMMPEMTGYDVCAYLKQSNDTKHIPIIFVSALNEESDEEKGFELGAVDYITKPVAPALVKARVKTHLSLVQSDELKRTRLQVIQRLGKASEYKDNETGQHVIRMSLYAKELSLEFGLSKFQADKILNASPMHDIGKIGIPDHILLKPGKLTVEEFEVMKQHPHIGEAILGESDSELIELAKSIAISHHEKWDGTGYPYGLSGEDIPLEGRIVAIADVFDALTTVRPYKRAWTVKEATDYIYSQSGKHFDPNLVECLPRVLDTFMTIMEEWGEDS
ncbi:response regulator [Marinomonas algicola]|jgi:putative two-component system response regulator|uniref:response regulator n=1 Tax=Marinomonas algicola TaxID=2773454 RepID=UPI00174AF88D|nr:two-component system response regulator [Marinomonas algicola]